jgi:predicted nuclease with TOPRIM domain
VLKATIRDLQKERDYLKARKEELREKRDTMRKERQQFRAEKEALAAELSALKEDYKDLQVERDDLAEDKKELEQWNSSLTRERDSLERRLTLLCDGKTRDGKIIGEIDVGTWMMRARQMFEHTDIVQSVCACRGYLVSASVDRTLRVRFL